jgi:sugar O-acyltransferase (sialic acid O-acetyltransferase NeuD family)
MPTRLTVTRPGDYREFKKESILQGIHERIQEQVLLYPDKTALVTEDNAYTYAQMNGHANSIAYAILAKCGTALTQAAILLPNSPEMVIAMLATLKAHKAYIPLDCNYPIERLRAMFEDAEPSVLLTDNDHQGVAEELAGNRVPIINTSQIERHADASNPIVNCDPLDRAYILYTSGSTGRPKGIVFLHRNLLHTTMCLTNELFFSPGDRLTWLHSPCFGSSVMDIYCSLTNGATLYPWDPKVKGFNGMAQWLATESMTTFLWLPSAFRQFMRTVPDGLSFPDMRIVLLAGEPLTIREVELFRRYFPKGSHLVNQVGTAESYNYYLYRVDHHIPIEDTNVAGGYPVSSDRKLLILDDAHHEVSQGNIGEIAIKSNYMSGGYWHNESQTKAKFIRIGSDDVPVYLTGDLGRLEKDGCLIHLGRKDFQFKIRGCRIEPAEIEEILIRVPGVADCVCWYAANRAGENELVGYVVPNLHEEFSQREAENRLEEQLPGYMVPRTYVLLDSLPALPNGKANRKALPNPFAPTEVQSRPNTVATMPVEQELLRIFAELLHVDQVTPETDFMDAGGDSLSAIALRCRIQQSFGVDVPMSDFSDSVTPACLSALIASISSGRKAEAVSSEQRTARQGLSTETLLPASASYTPDLATTVDVRSMMSASEDVTSTAEENLVIIGAGQSGREIFTWATQAIAAGSRFRIKGFLDDNASALKRYDYRPGVIGKVATYEIEERDVFVCAIGNPMARKRCSLEIERKGGRFINIIHPLANIGMHVEFGVGIVMGPFSSVTSDVRIGNHVSIGALSNVAHDTVIGNWCQISSHCGLNGCAALGEGVFLGSHVCVLPKVTVGSWAFVGAGSVVVRNVGDREKVFGNPAAFIGMAVEQ